MHTVTYQPKQKRSEQNLKKIIDAIMRLVEDKYFEKITIIEIANEANLSVGAFYRRFKNKDAALPVIYDHFQLQLREWLASKTDHWNQLPLAELVTDMTLCVYEFIDSKKGLFRTIYLNARQNSDVLKPQTLDQRINDYIYLAGFFQRFMPSNKISYQDAARFTVFTLVNNAMEKCVYPNVTPASACPHNIDASIEATSVMLNQYLIHAFDIQASINKS